MSSADYWRRSAAMRADQARQRRPWRKSWERPLTDREIAAFRQEWIQVMRHVEGQMPVLRRFSA